MATQPTAWTRLSPWTRGCLTLLLTLLVGSVLLLGLLYWGYCWGWWGRTNLTLQYLFQCQCPAASERVRYAPFTVLVSACRHPQAIDLAPSGRYLIIDEEAPPAQILRKDILTGQHTILPPHAPRWRRSLPPSLPACVARS